MRKPALKHILLSFVLALIACLLVVATPVSAQAGNPYAAPVNNPDVPQNLHTYSQNVMIEVMSAMICQLSGVDPIQPSHQCLGIDPLSQRIGYVQGAQDGVSGGAIGSMSNLIASTFQLPVNSGQYFNYLASSFGITKSAIAADPVTSGTGFDGLTPIIKVWTAIRDVVYVLFVIGFVAVGVGIMLRIKIDPRTVMTIQNRIPRIIAALILVTFSYAIAGFLIDFMWVTIYLIINLFASVDPGGTMQENIKIFYSLQGDNVLTYARKTLESGRNPGGIILDASRGFNDVIASMLANGPGKAISSVFGMIIGGAVGTGLGKAITSIGQVFSWVPAVGVVSKIIGGLAGGGALAGGMFHEEVTSFITSAVAFLIILVAVLSALFRLWFKLLIAFVMFMLGVILAPLWIFAGILPGNKLGFGSWIRHMLSQVIIFPITIGMFALGKVVIDGYKIVSDGGTGFVPPLLGYGAKQADVSSLIALGLILITPNVAKWAQDIFKGPKFDATPIGQALKAGTGTMTGGIKPIAAAVTKTPEMGKKPGFTGALRQIFKY